MKNMLANITYIILKFMLGFDPDEIGDNITDDCYGYSLAMLMTRIGCKSNVCNFNGNLPDYFVLAKTMANDYDETLADVTLSEEGLLHVLLYAQEDEFAIIRNKLKYQLKINDKGIDKIVLN